MRNEFAVQRTVALVLPMFFEYAQRVRRGILDWVERHGGWQVIELDPRGAEISPELAEHLDGAIVWLIEPEPKGYGFLELGMPVVHVGTQAPRDIRLTSSEECRITFDRGSLNDLALAHFASLGVHCVGYVGLDLKPADRWVHRVSDLRQKALDLGHEWVAFDLESRHPVRDPSLIWQGHHTKP